MVKYSRIFTTLIIITLAAGLGFAPGAKSQKQNKHKSSKWLLLKPEDITKDPHNLNHFKIFSKYAKGYNLDVLRAVDSVQAHAMDGGGYFTGMTAKPTESPVGYELKLFGKSLLDPPRTTSYCSGSSYAVLITALDFIFPNGAKKLSPKRLEAMRMQEPDGGRRNDWIKFWGIWNADGFGSEYALVQYGNMGVQIKPEDARPGDFMNISWKAGLGHSVVFLGWYVDKDNQKYLMYWSSQKGTNGYGDQVVPLSRIENVKIVRLTKPANIFKLNVKQEVNKDVPGDKINL